MSRGELAAWNTGADLARAEVDPDPGHHLTAWATGAARAVDGGGIVVFLDRSARDIRLMLSDQAVEAFDALPRDIWAYWVHSGYLAARAEQGR